MTSSQASIHFAVDSLATVLKEFPETQIAILSCTFEPGSSSMQVNCFDKDGERVDTGFEAFDLVDDAVNALQSEQIDPVLSIEISLNPAGTWEAREVTSTLDQIVVHPLVFDAPWIQLPPITPAEEAEIAQLWAQGSGGYAVQAPMTADAAEKLAVYLGIPIPPQLKALLRLSDGAKFDAEVEEGTLTAGWSFLSSAEIMQRHKQWAELAANGPYTGEAFDQGIPGVVQLRLLHPGWIPFAHDHGGNCLGIDLVPGPHGIAGQIIEYGRDLVDGPVRHADSLVDYLAQRRYDWPAPYLDHVIPPETPQPFIRAEVPEETESLRLFNLEYFAISAVHDLPLKALILRNIAAVDLSGIEFLPLQSLRLLDLKEADLAPLAGHPTLRMITVENVEKLYNVEALGALAALETVEMDSTQALDALGDIHVLKLPKGLRLVQAVDLINRVCRQSSLEITFSSGNISDF